MVVKDFLPLSYFSSSSGVQAIVGPIARKLMVSLDKDSVRGMMIARAQKMEQEIVLAMRNKPVFLKMDGTTWRGHSYLAINVQFILNDKPTIRTLAVMDCAGKHKAMATAEMVKSTMARYGLTKKQVFAMVTDNASVMVKSL